MCQKIKYSFFVLSISASVSANAAPTLSTPHFESSAYADAGTITSNDQSCYHISPGGTGVDFSNCTAAGANGAVNAFSTATAGPGYVQAGTAASGQSVDSIGVSARAGAYAHSIDYFAIQGPANTLGYIHGNVIVDGNVSVLVNGATNSNTVASSSYQALGSLNGYGSTRSGEWLRGSNGYEKAFNTSGEIVPVDVPIYFGADGWSTEQWITFRADLHSEGVASPGFDCTSSPCLAITGQIDTAASFASTIYWGGITSVTVNDVALSNYQIISASGIDYRYATAPVPELPPFLMMLIGVPILLTLKRIRNRSSSAIDTGTVLTPNAIYR